ncbi:ATP-binding protein [Paenibacillus alvei]|uniref:sensor histidine kinase n=1 Tax=Paenibacillus alvei TaxID=44250 RepID=UPI003D27B67A
MRMHSFKRQFITYFVWVIGASLVFTIVVWGGFIWLQSYDSGTFRPANYYEKKIPSIRKLVETEGDRLLNKGNQARLEQLIEEKGMRYAVVDRKGKYVYGSLTDPKVRGGRELIQLLNASGMTGMGHARNVLPIINQEEELQGAVILNYILSAGVTEKSKLRPYFGFLVIGVLFVPFLFVILFSWLFGKRFGRELSRPIEELIEGTRRVQQRDLDFSFSYEGTSEMSQLMKAFDEMRRELYLSLQREWKMEQRRREMVAALAHDLRTPLAIVQGHVEGLLDGGMNRPDRLERYLSTIDKNTKRAVRLVQEMNLVSEMESPQFSLNCKPIDINRFMEETAQDMHRMCAEQQIEFSCRPPADRQAEGTLLLDGDRLRQLMDNLLANSLRFTPAGGAIIWEAEWRARELQMSITDTGTGFPAHMLDSIFDKFVQGDASRSQYQGHSGLGLYMAKLIMVKHGGRIRAERVPGGGARIVFSFPTK